MKHETKYGTISFELVNEETIEVKSDIPFLPFGELFAIEDSKKAHKQFEELVKKAEEIIAKMEAKAKAAKTKKTSLQEIIKTLLNVGAKKILLYGPTGTGKTFSLCQICEHLKDEGKIDDYLLFVCSTGMEDLDLLGKFLPAESGKTLQFQESVFVEYIKKAQDQKIALIIDEFNRTSPRTLNILIPLLDEKSGKVRLNNFINSEIIEVPAENIFFFFTANFGGVYAGTHQVDAALLNRIDHALFVDYQKEVEEAILDEIENEDVRKAISLLREALRDMYKENTIHPFSTRDLKNMVQLVKDLTEVNEDVIYKRVLPILYKLVKNDALGYPDEETLSDIKEVIKKICDEL